MLEFIKSHPRLIAECALALVIFICSIARKKPVSDIESLIYKFANKATQIVENDKKTQRSASEKLAYAISLVNEMLIAIYPKIKLSSYYNVIKNIIEDTLKSPQATIYKDKEV